MKARIAVIGAGWWSTYTHIPALLADPRVELVALCDLDAAKLRAATDAYPIPQTYTNIETLLAKEAQDRGLDGAIIATSHASHYALARTCLEAGLHLLIEKPMTLYAHEAQALLDLASDKGCEIIVGYPFNYSAYARYARDLLQAEILGGIEHIHCTFSSNVLTLFRGEDAGIPMAIHGPGDVYSDPVRSGGGHGHLQMTHGAGLLFFITGLRMRRVHALMSKQQVAVDVVNAMTVEFDNGALGTVSGTGNLGHGGGQKFSIQVYCEAGWLDIDATQNRIVLHAADEIVAAHPPPVGGHKYQSAITAQNLASVILGNAQNGSPGLVGLRVVELLDAAYRSAAQDGAGVWVDELYSK